MSDLERSIRSYSQIVGLALLEQTAHLAQLGAHGQSRVLLELEALPGVKPIGKRTRLGIYHTAFLLPSRAALTVRQP